MAHVNGSESNPTLASASEAADEARARRRHRQRFRTQLLGWGLKVVLAAACYPLSVAAMDTYVGSHGAMLHSVLIAGLFLPSFAATCILISNWAYHRNTWHTWKLALSKAQHFLQTYNVMKGYTDIFSIYVRTKRRSYHVMAWGLLAGLYAFVAVGLSAGAPAWPVPLWASIALELISASLLLVLAYVLGSAYAPGEVLVEHTAALLEYATSDDRDQTHAKEQAKLKAEPFVHDNPWWFYPG